MDGQRYRDRMQEGKSQLNNFYIKDQHTSCPNTPHGATSHLAFIACMSDSPGKPHENLFLVFEGISESTAYKHTEWTMYMPDRCQHYLATQIYELLPFWPKEVRLRTLCSAYQPQRNRKYSRYCLLVAEQLN